MDSRGVSVVIPTYNRAGLLAATIRSVLDQSLPPLEVIVVDDGSSDNTAGVVGEFGDAVVFKQIEHGGVCRARNVGVAASRGTHLAFCDSDDLWSRDKLQEQTRLLDAGIPYVFTDFLTLRENIVSKGTKFQSLPPGYWNVPKRERGDGLVVLLEPFYGRILRHQPIFPSTVVLSRSLFDRVGGFDDALGGTVSEDLEFTLRCLEHSPIGVVMKPLVTVRKHGSNASGNPRRSLLGEAKILGIALERHSMATAHRLTIEAEILRRRSLAADFAFLEGDLGGVAQVLRPLRDRLGGKSRLKLAIAGLPGPFAELARRVTVGLSALTRSRG